MKIKDLERVNDAQSVKTVKLSMGRLANKWIHMNGVNSLNIRSLFKHATNRAEHPMHGLTKVLSTMGGNEHKAIFTNPIHNRMRPIVTNSCSKSINTRIARYPNLRRGFSLRQEILFRRLSRRKIPLRNDVNSLTIKFLRPWRVNVVGPQSRLNMANRHAQVKTR